MKTIKEKPSDIACEAKARKLTASICIFCGLKAENAVPSNPRFAKIGNCNNKYKTAFVRCPYCKTTLYLNSPLSVAGYETLDRIVRGNLDKYKKTVNALCDRKINSVREDNEISEIIKE